MATALSQSDAVYPFSDCSIASLFPRTIGLSISVGDAMFESEDQDIVSNLVKSTAMENFTNAKLISNVDCSDTSNVSRGDGNSISTKRSNEGQVEMQGKRVRQRRPGLPGVEREGNIFNFLANTTSIGASQIGTSHLSKRRSSSDVAMDSQSWPVIDYSCLENIIDPTEYFSTYRMLENAEEEVKRLKGDASSRVSRPQDRRDRQRRPGLSDLEGTKNVFKFPGIGAIVEASPSENSSKSYNTELAITSSSNEIRQTENSGSDVHNENDELQVLISKCREIGNADLPNILREALQINPIRVKKLRGLPVSVTTGTKSESKHRLVSPVTKENKIDGLSTMRGRLSLINLRGNPFFLDNRDEEKQSDLFKGFCSTGKDFCNDGMVKDNKLENLKSDFKDVRVDVMSKSEMEILKNKLLDGNEMKNPVAGLSALKKPIPLIDIQGRLDKISNLKRHILQSTTEGENMIFTHDDFEDSSLSNNREVHDLSPLDVIHLHGSCLETKSACVPHFSNGKQFSFVDEVHSPVAEILEANKNICGGKISDPKAGQFSLLEKETCPRSDEIICDKDLVHDTIFEKSGQASSLVDFRVNEVYSPVAEVSEADKNICIGKTSDPKGCQFSLLEKETCTRSDGIICDKELVSDTKFEEASSSVDLRGSKSLSNPFSDKLHPVFVSSETTDNSSLYVFGSSSLVEIQSSTSTQQALHADVPKDPCLPRKPALMNEQMDALNSGKNKNQRHSKASGGSRKKKVIKKKPVSRQKKQNQMMRRQSLAGAGTVWETGVRRSTRIRMKPLQYWCGERLLYGRVHDSLATVIGVKKFGTPQSGKTAVMKVKSYVSDDYADLVAQAALH